MDNLLEQLHLLPANLANHLMITVVALVVGVVISLPLGVVVFSRRRVRYPVLTAVSVVQTIPSLALLALMVPVLVGLGHLTTQWFGAQLSALGFWPTVIALTLYSMLPIVRNTVAGLDGVDASVTEAARGVGMTARQTLLRVQLPLAAPVILAGIRTATVWVVGIATLSTPVGQRSLGNFIFRGLQTRNWTMVLVGCVSAAVLAVVLDLLLAGVERSVAQRRRTLGLTSTTALVAVVALGLASPWFVRAAGRTTDARSTSVVERRIDRPIRIAAKTFTEQYILAALLQRTLTDSGYRVQRRDSLGSTVVFDALASGQIDLYVDYSGTIWSNYMPAEARRTSASSRQAVLDDVTWWLAREHGIRCLGPLGFENAYALAMKRQRAEELGVRTIADLTRLAPSTKIGGDYEFFGRPEWRDIRDGYNLRFQEEVSYDSTFMYASVAQGEVGVIAAFSSDGRIAAYDLVTLEDPRQVIPPYDAVLLLGAQVADDPHLLDTLTPLLRAIPVELMREANHMVDRDQDKRTVTQAAAWLQEQVRGEPTAP